MNEIFGNVAATMFTAVVSVGLFILVAGYSSKRSRNKKKSVQKKVQLSTLLADAEAMITELNKFSDYIISLVEDRDVQLKNTIKEADEKLGELRENLARMEQLKRELKELVSQEGMKPADCCEELPLSSDQVLCDLEKAALQGTGLPGERKVLGKAMVSGREPISEVTILEKSAAAGPGEAAAGRDGATSTNGIVSMGGVVSTNGVVGTNGAANTGGAVFNESGAFTADDRDAQMELRNLLGSSIPAMTPASRRHSEVMKLAASGLSDTVIAKKLQMGKGEVQLILGMKRE